MKLSAAAIRVLGTLMEKARTTPEVYPMTLNSLVNACNQKTSRYPVTDYDEPEVLQALDELREQRLAMRVDMAGSRVAKFRENAATEWELSREEYALAAILMLRGAQTPGQLRQRCERLYPFAELSHVTDCLNQLQDRAEEPRCMVRPLEHLPGTKEIRWTHTLGAEAEPQPQTGVQASRNPQRPSSGENEPAGFPGQTLTEFEERLDRLEQRVQELETLLNELTS